MSEHFTRRTEEVLHWCDVCQRRTSWTVSAGRIQRCAEHGTDIRRYYCDVCKEGTPHILDKSGRATCLAHKPSETEEFRFDHTTERHLAALDGTGNRGEKKGDTQNAAKKNSA